MESTGSISILTLARTAAFDDTRHLPSAPLPFNSLTCCWLDRGLDSTSPACSQPQRSSHNMRRDRRSTGLSISTLSSSSNASSPVVVSSIEDAHDPEKGHFLLLPPRLEQDDGLPSPYLKAAQQEAARRPWHRRLAGSVTRTRILLAAIVFTLFLHRSVLTITAVQNLRAGSTLYSVKEGTVLDVEPDAILIQDEHGHTKWAVSIPGDAPFPLRQYQYRQLCASAWSLTRRLHSDMSWATGYYARDKRYLDVLDAEHAGVFTNISSQPPIPVVGLARAGSNLPTCARSMVFIMDTEDAGFGTSLLSLWLAYGLAKREKRAFFINDHGWQYGTYSTYFPLPPLPGCAPPPASTVVPCPHQAAHLAVTAATIRETFGGQFHAHFTKAISPRGIFSRSHDPIYDMTRTGYEALYGLAGEDAAFARARIQELRDQARSAQRPVVGMHIRRGDRHPFEYEFQNDYLPLERYTAAATTLLNTIRTTTHSDSAHNASTAAPPLLVASDDPDIITSPDLAPGPSTPSPAMGGSERPLRLERVQSRIVLASKRTLQPTPAAPDDGSSAFVKHVDEVSGWEGGFFAGLFRGLGRDPASRRYPSFESAAVLRTTQVETAALRGAGADSGSSNAEAASWLRELVGRAYVLDLGVLAGGSDGVVCAVSSATCRVLGVMMGRDKVRAGKGWVNVDDGRGWSWDGLH